MRLLLIRIFVLAVAFGIVDALMDTVTVDGGFFGAVGVAVVYGILAAVVGTLLRMLTLPVQFLTVGLIEFVINALLLLLTDWLIDSFEVASFGSALVAALVLSIASVGVGLVISLVFRDPLGDEPD